MDGQRAIASLRCRPSARAEAFPERKDSVAMEASEKHHPFCPLWGLRGEPTGSQESKRVRTKFPNSKGSVLGWWGILGESYKHFRKIVCVS